MFWLYTSMIMFFIVWPVLGGIVTGLVITSWNKKERT